MMKKSSTRTYYKGFMGSAIVRSRRDESRELQILKVIEAETNLL